MSVLAVLSLVVSGATLSVAAPEFEIEKLADGVYAAIAIKPPGLMVQSNSLIVVNDDDVVVVDANLTQSATREIVAAIRKLTPKPVRYVINTHGHDDHLLGNAVYRDAFPGVEFVAHRDTLLDLQGVVADNRDRMLQDGPAFAAQLAALLAKGENLSGQPMTAGERASYASDVALAERYFAETPTTPVVLPTLVVEGGMTLRRGERTLEIRHLGRGHTRGDLVVHLPRERIVAAGDLVIAPVPLVGADQSYVADWSATLQALRALRPAIIVPGHGKVLRDDAYVALMADTLAAARRETEGAIARGETLEQAAASVTLSAFRPKFSGGDRVLDFLFAVYVARPAVGAVYRESAPRARVDRAGIRQVWVPAGAFTMGSRGEQVDALKAMSPPAWVARALPSEQPAHEVRLTRGYWIDTHEVTEAAFKAFVDAGGYRDRSHWSDAGWAWLARQDPAALPSPCEGSGPEVPRRCVTWFEAEAYARWRGGRLPTEAEWEYAARGPRSAIYPWGNEFDPERCNVVGSTGPKPVGSYPEGVSWVGAHDMSGNAMEWVSDWLDVDYYRQSPVDDPRGPAAGKVKVEKGGWWGSNPFVARGAYRHFEDPPEYRDAHIGFRVVTP